MISQHMPEQYPRVRPRGPDCTAAGAGRRPRPRRAAGLRPRVRATHLRRYPGRPLCSATPVRLHARTADHTTLEIAQQPAGGVRSAVPPLRRARQRRLLLAPHSRTPSCGSPSPAREARRSPARCWHPSRGGGSAVGSRPSPPPTSSPARASASARDGRRCSSHSAGRGTPGKRRRGPIRRTALSEALTWWSPAIGTAKLARAHARRTAFTVVVLPASSQRSGLRDNVELDSA